MEKDLLEQKLKEGSSLRQLAKDLDTSFTNIRYWVKKYKLKVREYPIDRKCKCGEIDPDKFYGRRKNMCANCFNKRSHNRNKQRRDYIIEKLGGKCKVCGFDQYKSSFNVHHLDPSKKDINFGSHRSWSKDRIDRELLKCVLLCSNCHLALHGGELEYNNM